MYLASRRQPLARRATAVALVLAAHVVAVAGFLQVRARPEKAEEQVAIQVSLLDGPQQQISAPERPRVQLLEVKPVVLRLPQVDLPAIVPPPASTAITVVAPIDAAPPPPSPAPSRATGDAPVLVASVDYLKAPPPRYPVKARRTRAEGTVLLQVLIDTQGHPREVKLHRSSGHEELDVAARETVLAWLFRPYVENGVARNALVIVPVEFALTVRTASR